MKTKIVGLLVALVAMFGLSTEVNAALAKKVTFHTVSLALPDTTVLAFQQARNQLMTNLAMGGGINTTSRIAGPFALEPRISFETGDLAAGTNKLWRGKFIPSGAFIDQVGSRPYAALLAYGNGGKVRLSDLSYQVICGISALNNSSSFASSTYSISRWGVNAGTDGLLFTSDDQYVTSGSATAEVDAIVFIGARLGALVNSALDLQVLNNAIGADGSYVAYRYTFSNSVANVTSITTNNLYQMGTTPTNYNKLNYALMPKGLFCYVQGPENSGPLTLEVSRDVGGPYSIVTDQAWEGNSVFLPFMRNSTNDWGYANLKGNFNVPVSLIPQSAGGNLVKGQIIATSSTDEDQDR
jgi:hypothetical protein